MANGENDKLRQFYGEVAQTGAITNLPDFDRFSQRLSEDPKARKTFYDEVSRSGAISNLPDFEAFSSQLFDAPSGQNGQPPDRPPDDSLITVSGLNALQRFSLQLAKASPVLGPAARRFGVDPEELSRPESFVGTIGQRLVGAAGNLSKSIGIAAQKLSVLTGIDDEVPLEDLATYKFGTYLEQTAEELFPANPEFRDEMLAGMVPTIAGDLIAFATAGRVSKTLGTLTAMTSLAVPEYETALEATGDEDIAFKTFLANLPIGATEMLPAARLLNRLNRASGGSVSKFMSKAITNPALREGLVGGGEEMIQEMIQTGLTNVAAGELYDTTRSLTDGMWEGAAAGATVGFLLNALGVSVRRRLDKPDITIEERQEVAKSLAWIEHQKNKHTAEQLGDVPRNDADNPFLDSYKMTGRQPPEQQTSSTETPQDAPLGQPVEPDNRIGEVPDEGLVVTARSPNGTVYFGKPGEAHATLTDRLSLDIEQVEMGFGDASGRFLNRNEASQFVNREGMETTAPGTLLAEELRERGAFTTQKEKGALDEEFIEEFEKRGDRLYKPISDDATIREAEQYVQQHGTEEARIAVLNRSSALSFRHRVAIGHKVLADLDAEFRSLKNDGDPKAVNKLDEQIEFANEFYKLGTELGRGVRAFSYHSRFSPEARVRMYQREIDTAKADGKDVQFDKKVARKILLESRKIKQMPDGFAKQEATQDLMAFIANQTPDSKTDIGIALAYANILSGFKTQIVNFGATALNVSSESFTLAMANPRASWDITLGLWQGFMKGIPEARAIMKTGKVTGTRSFKGQIPAILERKKFKGLLSPLNLFKYVGRVMSASDVMFFKSAEEMRARVLARHLAIKQPGSNKKISKRVNEILKNTDTIKTAARQQATDEGFKGRDFTRRVYELVEQQRPPDLMDSASEFGLKATFNNDPQGYLGFLAKKISETSTGIPALRTVVPFTKIVSNVTNTFLDYTPAGYVRLFDNPSKQRNAPEIGTDLWRQQAAKATVGTAGMILAAWKVGESLEENDPFFTITGRGTGDFRRNFQLRETGWKEYSVKFGDTHFSYRETPYALALSLVGNYYDAIRYRNLDEEDALRRVSYALRQVPHTLLNMSFLSGMSDFFTAASRENISKDESLIKSVIDEARGFVVPNIIRQIDQVFDPRIYTSDDITEALVRDFPVARSTASKPIINMLGEPVRGDFTLKERAFDRFVSIRKPDPIWRTITEKQAWISHPRFAQTTLTLPNGDTRGMTRDEYYNYMLISGRKIKVGLAQNLAAIRSSPPADAQKLVSGIVREARDQAKRTIAGRLRGAPKLTP